MTRLVAALRRWAREALSGMRGPRMQTLAWRVANLHPRWRIVGRVRKGEIEAPLAALRRRGFAMGAAQPLRERLEDMARFTRQQGESGRAGAGPQGVTVMSPVARMRPLWPFDRRALFALHSCGAFDPSGYSARSVALINALQTHGVEPTITLRPGYPWDLAHHRHAERRDHVVHEGLRFELEPDPECGLRDPDSRYIDTYATHLEQLARRGSVEVIHAASNFLNGAAAAMAARRLGVPSIYEVRGLWHLTRAFSDSVYAGSEHFRYCEAREVAACQAADHVVTLSPGLQAWLVERGVDAGKVTIVGNAARQPAETVADRRQLARAVRERMGIPAAAQVVGYLGALVEYEGLEGLVQAHARTPLASRPFLLIVGSGRLEAQLKRLVADLGSASTVKFAGRVPSQQVGAWYEAMDAVVLPRRDGQLTRLVPAIKPFEVVAHGRPLFVSAALAHALGPTLLQGYRVVDVEALGRLDRLFETADPAAVARSAALPAVPTWDDRATALNALYGQLTH